MTTQADVRRILAWRDRAARTFGAGSGAGIAAPAASENALPTMAMHAPLERHRQPMEVDWFIHTNGAGATRGVRASDVEAYEELNVEL